jgi:hypothetical protein
MACKSSVHQWQTNHRGECLPVAVDLIDARMSRCHS